MILPVLLAPHQAEDNLTYVVDRGQPFVGN